MSPREVYPANKKKSKPGYFFCQKPHEILRDCFLTMQSTLNLILTGGFCSLQKETTMAPTQRSFPRFSGGKIQPGQRRQPERDVRVPHENGAQTLLRVPFCLRFFHRCSLSRSHLGPIFTVNPEIDPNRIFLWSSKKIEATHRPTAARRAPLFNNHRQWPSRSFFSGDQRLSTPLCRCPRRCCGIPQAPPPLPMNGISSNTASTTVHSNNKRARKPCSNCINSKVACDQHRPCGRCILTPQTHNLSL